MNLRFVEGQAHYLARFPHIENDGLIATKVFSPHENKVLRFVEKWVESIPLDDAQPEE